MRPYLPQSAKRIALAVACAAMLAPTVAGVAAQDAPASAAMAQGNAERTGQQPGPGPDGKPTLAWRFQTGDAVRSSPVPAGGALYFGSNDRTFYSVDAESGEERWRFPTEGPIIASAVVSGDRVYFGSGDGFVYALETETGKEIWRFYAGGRSDFRAPSAAPAEDGAAAVLHTEDPTDSDRVTPAVSAALNLAGGALYVGNNDHTLYALDPETGIERWHSTLVGPTVSPAAVANGLVYAGSEQGILAFDAATGGVVWDGNWHPKSGQNKQPSEQLADNLITVSEFLNRDEFQYEWGYDAHNFEWEVIGGPAVAGGKVYATGFAFDSANNREAGLMLAIDALTGGVTGAYFFAAYGGVLGGPAVVDGVAYLGTDQGFVHAVDTTGAFAHGGAANPGVVADLANGEIPALVERWGAQVGQPVYVGAAVAVAGGTVFLATQGGAVYALEAETGVRRWLFPTEGPIWSAPAVVDGLVYVGSDDGYLYAIGGS